MHIMMPRDRTPCSNLNHRRTDAPVRFCPSCGETVNAEGFSNDRYREIVNAISTQPDAAKRKPLYDQLNDFLLDEQFVIVVVSNAESVVSRANVQNVQWDLHGARKYAEMWLA